MRRSAELAAWLGALLLTAAASARVFAADAPGWRRDFDARYAPLEGLAPDVIVLEMRGLIGRIASRGSAVGSASMAPRVRGYEVVLLPALQQMGCSGSNAGAAPAPGLAEAVQHAATSQRLALQGADLAELSALAQRLLEGVDRRRWCALRSFDEVR